MLKNKIDKLAIELLETFSNSPDKSRYFLGVTGGPAAGKSMLAKNLTDEINFRTGDNLAAVVPMDAFHLPDSILKERGLFNSKGAPETFDAGSFVELINRLHEFPDRSIMCPAYDRKKHEPVKNSITIRPWNRLRAELDEIWYLDTPLETIKKRFYQQIKL